MKTRLATLLILALAICKPLMAQEIEWRYEYDLALAEAKKLNKPVLIDFSASWCSYCHMMDSTTFKDPAVQAALQRDYVTVKIDFDRNPALVGTYQIRGIPAFVLLNSFGEMVSNKTGYCDAKDFLAWIGGTREEAMAMVSKAQALDDKFKALGNDLRSSDTAVRLKAVYTLAALCVADKEGQERKLGEARLKEVVNDNPALVVQLLNDPRLAMRILFSNLFADKFGAQFVFDPWDDAAPRAKFVDEWARKLNAAPPAAAPSP